MSYGSFDTSEKIRLTSQLFLGAHYVGSRLIGSLDEPEQLVVDFAALDCFTYLDYVEALRKTNDFHHDFKQNIIQTRYIDSNVSYLARKHFLSDWLVPDNNGNKNADDITSSLSAHAVVVPKMLNQKEDDSVYIEGLAPKYREIVYIPSEFVDESVLAGMRTGDYIGMYTGLAGLDVTHTGIYIETPEGPIYRNASSLSANMKVVDTPLFEYIEGKPGIVVYRAAE